MKKVKPRIKELVENIKVLVVLLLDLKSKFLVSKRLEDKILKKKEFKRKFCSSMTSLARCDPTSNGTILKSTDFCPDGKYNCQKRFTFTRK